MDKLLIYQKLGVREVWTWRRGRIHVHVLRGEEYEEVPRSEFFPGIDLDLLVTFLDRPTISQAKRDYRAALEAARTGAPVPIIR
jgi:hypothetical protein